MKFLVSLVGLGKFGWMKGILGIVELFGLSFNMDVFGVVCIVDGGFSIELDNVWIFIYVEFKVCL